MLLPSALPCDPRPSLRRFGSFKPGPVCSPPTHATAASPSQLSTNLNTTCRALQSLLVAHPPPASLNQQMRKLTTSDPLRCCSSAKVTKRVSPPRRSLPPPRGRNKRSRDTMDEDGSSGQENMDVDLGKGSRQPSTPKRRRLAPPSIPFGLDRQDFYSLSSPSTCLPQSSDISEAEDEENAREDLWETSEDALLVDLVLDKLKLTKRDWNECARALGQDGRSLGERWRTLVDKGRVGLRYRGADESGSMSDDW